MYVLIEIYLQFSTQTSIQMIEYKNINNENHVSMQSIPALTLCYENIFENILIDPYLRQYFTNTFNTINITNVMKFTINLNETNDYINETLVYYLKYMSYHSHSLMHKQIINMLITNIINTPNKYITDFN